MRTSHARPLPGISVVIPTYNRSEQLARTLERCRDCAGPVELELVVIDDGSRDDTPARLEDFARRDTALVWRSIPNGGPGQARNLGASLAKHEVVLFLGDDIEPTDADFFLTHAELHAEHPERGFGVLGKVVWPNRADAEVSFVMAHVQGRGGEQFGYADFEPYSYLDWRFFYTANVSVKRSLVDDWPGEGFSSAFSRYGYEDGEFAYRMMKREEPLKLLYVPASVAYHQHPLTADAFLDRQISAGMMARVFLDLHDDDPELPWMLGVATVEKALSLPARPGDAVLLPDLLGMIEGVKSWVRILERMQRIGSQWWHDELLRAAFQLAYRQGYALACSRPDANLVAACWSMLDAFGREMRRTVHVELAGVGLGRRDIEGLFSLDHPLPAAGPALRGSWARIPGAGRLRGWLRRLFLETPVRMPGLRERVKANPRLAHTYWQLRRLLGIS